MSDQRFTIQFVAEEPMLLREAIGAYGISKRALTSIKFDGGEITVNGEEQNVRYPLSAGDVVTIKFPLEQASDGLLVEYGELDIVYEDDAVLVLNKPAGMSSIPSREHPTGSVANYVLGYFTEKGIASTIHIVTRLDRDTSGLMCIAKHRHIHYLMSEMQKAKQIKREYEAIAHGSVSSGTVIAPIGRKSDSIIEREVRSDGQYAHTDIRLLRELEVGGKSYSYIRLKLYTGRTHQIRVHLAHLGHPLVGDELYGGERGNMARQALHCAYLEFVHPVSAEKLRFELPLAQDIKDFLQK